MVAFGPLVVVVLGAAIGATGIGGVGLVPILVEVWNTPLETAVPTSLAAFVVTGIVGVMLHHRGLRTAPKTAVSIALACGVGAVAGALAFPFVSGIYLEIAIGFLMLMVGLLELARGKLPATGPDDPRATRGVQSRIIGFAVGFGSALTGTGGPVLYVPLMLLLGREVRNTVAVAQLIQIPIAGAAISVHLARDALDLRLALTIGLFLGAGAIAGALFTRQVNTRTLRGTIGLCMIAGGIVFLALRLV